MGQRIQIQVQLSQMVIDQILSEQFDVQVDDRTDDLVVLCLKYLVVGHRLVVMEHWIL